MRVIAGVLVLAVVACDPSGSRKAPAASPVAAQEDAGATPPPVAIAVEDAGAPARRSGVYANLDPDDDLVVGPPEVVADCEDELARAGVTWKPYALPVHEERRKKSKIVCGAPQVVVYVRGPANIVYNERPVVTCSMALALASFERLVDAEAARLFDSPVVRIDQIGTYACREVAAYSGTVSEHSYANAIDIGRFVLQNGKAIDVLHDFDTGDAEPKKPGGAFLRAISRRAQDEDLFSHVLTPFFNATHRNHFHLDLARFRTDGTRPLHAINP